MPKKAARTTSAKLPLMKRFALNKAKQLRRLDELDKEMDQALDKGEVPKLPSQDPKYRTLRREYEELEREFDQRNLKRFASQAVAIYGGEEGKTVTTVAAVAGVRAPRKKAKTKTKTKRRIRF